MIHQDIVKLIDFGFATPCTEVDEGSIFCGTPVYMSPEIVSKKPHNYMKADIWALGIVLFALLTGKFPFKGETNKDLYKKIARGSFQLPDVSMEAKAVLLKML